MKLSEIFFQLTNGELSQIAIGGGASGEINEKNQLKVLGHVTVGLTALYTRFSLKEKQLRIPLQSDADTYRLDLDDLLKIEKVCADSGYELGLNASDDVYSCSTPTLRSLRVPQDILNKASSLPDELKTDALLVTYRANHPKITESQLDLGPENVDIALPDSHLEALLYFVASRLHNPIGMVNEFNAGNNYAAKYEMACQQLASKGLQVDTESGNSRLGRGGWV